MSPLDCELFLFKGGNKMDYKETLLMPKTEFQMKGNLPENEKLQRQKMGRNGSLQ